MKKQVLFTTLILLSMGASAHDFEMANADGVTIYYNYTNNNTELEVTYRGSGYKYDYFRYTDNVVIPNEVTYMNRTRKVTSIGVSAFSGCSYLTSVTFGNSVTSIGSDAFSNCSGLQKVIVTDIAAWCDIKFEGYYANPLYYANHLYSDENTEITDLVIPNNVTSISDRAFQNCSSLTSVTIPNSVTYLSGFSGCSGLTSITIPNSVTSIGNGAFEYCSGLTSVIIPNSVTSIGDRSFSSCTGLSSIIIPNSVTSIGEESFSYCSGFTSITIPNSVTSIGRWAFLFCSGLTSVTIGNSVTSIGECPFVHCKELSSIIVDENNTTYDSRENCNAIIETATNTLIQGCNNTVIPNSVTSIGGFAFNACSDLTSVTIPNGVTSIGNDAFNGCSGLTTIEIPNSVTSIEMWAFHACRGLTSIIIPNSVTSIGYRAFGSCTGLTSVTIGNSVTSIGAIAFDRADIPIVISLIENPFPIDGKTSEYKTFSINTFNNATLYVPKGTIDKYKATDGWKDFFFIEEGAGPNAGSEILLGDVNGDGTLSVTDVGMMISFILGQNPEGFNEEAADMNGDSEVTVTDVGILITNILEAE